MKTKELELLLSNGKGALPRQAIETLKSESFIKNSQQSSGPASLDLTLSEECYEIERVIMPKKGEEVFKLLKREMKGKKLKNFNLFPGKQYLIGIEEEFLLPSSLYGYINPKSTTGRTFVHCRSMIDGVDKYDHLPRECYGKIWALVIPQVFPISYIPGVDTLNQIRLIIKGEQLSQMEIQSIQHKFKIMKEDERLALKKDYKTIRGNALGYMIFSADCIGQNGIVGYKAKQNKNPLPIGGIRCADWKDYFEIIRSKKYLELDPRYFYLLSTKERVSIPPQFAAEVKPVTEGYGEFRSHYAGFVDSGFGYKPDDLLFGNTITLEVRVFEKTILRHGQPVACLQFEKMVEIPDQLYSKTSGTYASQLGARLPKQF